MTIRTLLPILALALAACANDSAPLGAGFGDAVRHNKAVHILNPSPSYGTDVPPTSGAHLGAALADYYGVKDAPPPSQTIVLSPATTGQ